METILSRRSCGKTTKETLTQWDLSARRGGLLSRLNRVFFSIGPFLLQGCLETKCRRGEGGIRALIPREKTPSPPPLLDKCPRTICLQRNCCASFCFVWQTRPPCSLLGSTLFLCGLCGDSVSFCQPRKCLFLLPFSYCISQFGRFVFPNRLVDCLRTIVCKCGNYIILFATNEN